VKFTHVLPVIFTFLLVSCGGGGGDSNIAFAPGGGGTGNQQPIEVNSGINNDYVNGLFTTVTICVPGTTTCQNIDNVLVDTGSFGLRIIGSALNISLPGQTDNSGAKIGECTVFVDGYAWGPVAFADVQIAGKTASSAPIQVIGVSSFPSVPSPCSGGNGQALDTVATLGANGVLGIGVFAQDCGSACVSSTAPGFYFACTSACSSTTLALDKQVQNPVSLFASDNNGVLISLPSIDASGAVTVSGSLIFGIGTQANNALNGAAILTTDGVGDITTNFNNSVMTGSFVDSGSNAFFFPSLTIPRCGTSTFFYCPTSALILPASMVGQNATSVPISFSVSNADALFSNNNGSNAAFDNLAGPSGANNSFDWGLPFFYGRHVFFAIEGASTPGGSGPYVAFY
jgi:hypothetical protein